jgi:nitrite reductase/ring-hydroxylating ferredoxin subunit
VRPVPRAPFEALEGLSPETWAAIEVAALEANDSYLTTFLEPGSFCPFSKGGRKRGQTARFVHRTESTEVEPLLARMLEVARDPSKLVIQVIVPLVEVEPAAWSAFCRALTEAGNDRLRGESPDGGDILAVAPLHPELPYTTRSPYSLIPLFRRTPDPTIQWVRNDALEALYRGRTGDTVFIDPAEVLSAVARPPAPDLFTRIAESNVKMAQRLGIAEVERTLRELAAVARERYARIVLGADPARGAVAVQGAVAEEPALASPRAPLARREGRVALARASELLPRVPVRVEADDVELIVVRGSEGLHVLHGRCPHRSASLADAIVADDHLVCRRHGWDFLLASGRSAGVPGAEIARFDAEIDDDLVWIEERSLARWRAENPVIEPYDEQ